MFVVAVSLPSLQVLNAKSKKMLTANLFHYHSMVLLLVELKATVKEQPASVILYCPFLG